MARFAATHSFASSTFRTVSVLLLTVLASAILALAQDEKTGSLSTDKIDYQPGDVVTITGDYWAPGETVSIAVAENPQVDAESTIVAVADENGHFTNTDFVITQNHIGVHFILTATGSTSGYSNYIHFFDASEGPKTTGTALDYTIAKSNSGNTIVPATNKLPFANNNGNQMQPLALPFAFRVYATTFAAGANISITNNGVVQFASNLTNGNSASITAAPFNRAFLPYWDNLNLNSGNPATGIFWSVTGNAPNRILNIEWRQIQLGNSSNQINFEARFFETTNIVEFIYGAGPGPTIYGGDATIGVLETNTTHYTQHSSDTAGTVGPGVKLTLTPGSAAAADTVPPVITVPADITLEATGALTPVPYSGQSATDDVDGPLTATCTPASGSSFPVGVNTVTCSATDKAGNQGSKSFKITITDTAGPTISVGGLTNGVLTSKDEKVVSFTATATDLVDGSRPVTCTPASGSTFNYGATEVNCTSSDTRNNMGTFKFTVQVTDGTAPVLTLPSDINKEATSAAGATATFAVSAQDDVDGALTPTCDQTSGATFPVGVTTVHCLVKDKSNNEATGSFKITVEDKTPPSVTVPGDVGPIEATGPDGATATFSVTATDLVDTDPKVTCDHTSGSKFPVGATTVSCTAKDASGNESASKTFKVTVQDTTPPTLTVPADISKEGDTLGGAKITFAATASDLVDPNPAVECDQTSGSVFPVGETTVSCTAVDASKNKSAAKTFKVTVTDTTPPKLTLPTDITKEGDTLGGAHVTFATTAEDIVDGSVEVACTPASGALFAVETKKVDCSAKDKHGNESTGSFNVTVHDTTPPAVTVPADMTIEATGPSGATGSFLSSAHDIVDGDITTACTPASGTTFALGTHAVKCTATDKAGNSADKSFNITVQDTTPPALMVPSDMIVEATGPTGAAVPFATSATDLVDGAVAVTCVPASGSTFALGTTHVSCSATDAHGNPASGGFNVLVRDTTPPALTLPGNLTAIATSPQGAPVTFTTSAVDLVSGTVPVNCSAASGAIFAPGTTTVTCSAMDQALNKAQGSFTVSVTFSWSGFLQPINIDNSSVFKQGSTVPVKFQLTGPSAVITNLTAKILVAKVSNGVIGSFMEDVVSTSAATTGNLFRYDPTSNQYIFNWSTKGYTTGTYIVKVDMLDGVDNRTVYVGLR